MLYWTENMRYLRAKLGLSQQRLADELGITRARYSKYEYGMSEPPIELLIKIARYYQLSLDQLVSENLHGQQSGRRQNNASSDDLVKD